jgi:hypothetical protein
VLAGGLNGESSILNFSFESSSMAFCDRGIASLLFNSLEPGNTREKSAVGGCWGGPQQLTNNSAAVQQEI